MRDEERSSTFRLYVSNVVPEERLGIYVPSKVRSNSANRKRLYMAEERSPRR